jgi:hypothetical protein
VLYSNEMWFIQVFNPVEDASEQAGPLWEEACKLLLQWIDREWKEIARFGRINVQDNPGLLSSLPVKIQVFPSVIAFSPTGEYDILPYTTSFSPAEMRDAMTELLAKCVDIVPTASAKSYMQLEPSYYGSAPLANFNFLLLRKRFELPRPLLKYAVDYYGWARFGTIEPKERTTVVKELGVDNGATVLLSYIKETSTNTRKHVLYAKALTVTTFASVLDTATKHTIVSTCYKTNAVC